MKKFLLILILISSIMVSCNKENADLILMSGKIYTVNQNFEVAEAIAIKDGKILAVGTTAEITSKYQSDNTINLNGKFVYPGFNDAHCHFLSYGHSLEYANLNGTKSTEEIITKLKEHQKKYKSNFILGRGWDQNNWEIKDFPNKKILDENFPNTPVILTRIDGHAVWVNSKAIEISGFTTETKIEGGKIFIENNELTGILLDNAIESFNNESTPKSLNFQNSFRIA